MDEDYEQYWIEKLSKAPRVTSMSEAFEAIASGKTGQPLGRIPVDLTKLSDDHRAVQVAPVLERVSGHFDQHYTGSIPYAREEEVREIAAYWSYGEALAKHHGRPAKLYILSGGDGPVVKALARLAPDHIEAMTCSPSESNEREFFDHGASKGSYFFLGPYFMVTPTELTKRGMPQFADGFDLIQEDTAFQMYDRNRSAQLDLMCRNLKKNGICILLEKFMQPNIDDFLAREHQKNQMFKSKYFSTSQIEQKQNSIVKSMDDMLVTVEELTTVLKTRFRAAVMTYNTGNFCNIAASEDPAELQRFLSHMLPPATPAEFTYYTLPMVLFGPPGLEYAFKEPAVA